MEGTRQNQRVFRPPNCFCPPPKVQLKLVFRGAREQGENPKRQNSVVMGRTLSQIPIMTEAVVKRQMQGGSDFPKIRVTVTRETPNARKLHLERGKWIRFGIRISGLSPGSDTSWICELNTNYFTSLRISFMNCKVGIPACMLKVK